MHDSLKQRYYQKKKCESKHEVEHHIIKSMHYNKELN